MKTICRRPSAFLPARSSVLKMYFLIGLSISFYTTCFGAKLQNCNESTELKDICKNVNDYDPNMASKPWPTNVKIFMDIQEIVNFDWDHNTVTIFVEFWTMWNDTRLSITNGESDG